MIVCIFSKNRAMQLDATLTSIFATCKGIEKAEIVVLYKTTSELHDECYEILKKDYPKVNFKKEVNFKEDFISIITKPHGYVMFLTDDTIFVKNFSSKEIIDQLHDNILSVGFSLRLGMNTTDCYMQNKTQRLPEFESISENILKYNWTTSESDFGYPLELSSSVYRLSHLLFLFMKKEYTNPNSLETAMYQSREFYSKTAPELLCYKKSVAFSNPCNLVQDKTTNRHGDGDVEELAKDFKLGDRIDTEKYRNLVSKSVHQIEELQYHE